MVVDPSDQTLCNNSLTAAVNFSGTATSFSWTNTNTSIGLAASGTSNFIPSFTAVNAGTVPEVATVTITPHYDNAGQACTGSTQSFTITVNPTPTGSPSVTTQSVCSGSQTAITLTPGFAAVSFAWVVQSSTGASGASGGSGTTISQTLNASGTSPGTVVYRVTPSAYGCNGTPFDVTVTVNPIPVLTISPTSATICSGDLTAISLSSNVGGTSFDWTITPTNITGASAGNGSSIAQTLSATNPSVSGNVIYTVTPLANTCPGTAKTVTVTVQAVPTAGAIGVDQSICPNTSPNPLTSTTAGTGSGVISYFWERSTDGGANWSVITSATAASYSPGALAVTTMYRRTTVSTQNGKACNSVTTVPVTIAIGDNVPPTFTAPTATTRYKGANCTVDLNPAATGNVSNLNDNCTAVANLLVTYVDGAQVPTACPSDYSFTRTWTVTDASGNHTDKTQVITVKDQTAPILNVPADIPIACSESSLPAHTGQATATDNCDNNVTITYTDASLLGACANNYGITRTWTATDCSGNTSTGTQIITISDTEAPMVTMYNPTVTCPDDIPIEYKTMAGFLAVSGNTATDNCGSMTVELYSEESLGLDDKPGYCPSSVVREYKFTDACGNFVIKSQTITVQQECNCNPCDDNTQFVSVDLFNDPNGSLHIPNLVRTGRCCSVDKNDRCISFNIRLHPDAVGLSILVGGAAPSPHEWNIDCVDVPITNGVICLPGGEFQLFTFCKPGNNPESYTFQSVPGIVSADDITTRVECNGQISTQGIVSGAQWTSIWPGTQGQYNHYLSSTTVPNPNFYADENAPAEIHYQVCGNIGNTVCNALGQDCDTIVVHVRPLIDLVWDVDPTMVCEDAIPPLTAQISPANANYLFEWYYGSDANPANQISGQTTATYQPTSAGQYSLKVTDLEGGVPCSSRVFNFEIKYDETNALVFGPPEGNLNIECNAPNAAQIIDDWINTASAEDDDGTPLQVHDNYTGINMACGTVLPVKFWAEDDCGNIGEVTFYITVIDTEQPWFLTNAQNSASECTGTDPALNQAFLDWMAAHGGATATDQCDNNLVWSDNMATQNWSGDPCNNQITVTFTVTDACTNKASTTATFTVQDTQGPSITCPPTAYGQTEDAECHSTTVNLGWPTASDICSAVEITNSAPAQFPFGTSIVTWTAKDACGNTSTCKQTIIVGDSNNPPTITCPPNVTASAAPGDCDMPVTTIQAPVTGDNCGVVLQTWVMSGATTSSSPSNGIHDVNGSTFNIGITTVTYTVGDAAGNTASCSFSVTVKDQTPPVISSCPQSVTDYASLGICEKYLAIQQPIASDPCGESYTISHNSPYGASSSDASGNYPVGTTTITWTVTDASGNLSTCTQVITIIDNQLPQLTCPGNQEDVASPTLCYIEHFNMPDPVYSDNCPNPVLTYEMTGVTSGSGNGSVNGLQFNVGVTQVTYTVTDASDNEASCSFTVTVKDVVPPQFSAGCPVDILDVEAQTGLCGATIAVPVPLVDDPCDEGYTVVNDYTGTDNASGYYEVGTTYVNWTITDASGNKTECQQTVRVVDTQVPVIACPSNIEQTTTADNCKLEDLIIPSPVYSDNCPDSELSYVLSGATTGEGVGSASGLDFKVGVTTVTYTVTDASDNTASCSFTVWAKDLVKPEFTFGCPANIGPIPAENSSCQAFISVPVPEVNDPCNEGYTIVNSFNGTSNASGYYPVGLTTVTWTITDASNNVNTCTQRVEVIDTQNPTIACPANYEQQFLNGGCDISDLTIPDPTVGDNCGIRSLSYVLSGATVYSSPLTGMNYAKDATFQVGVTIVTYLVTDLSGNTATCNFTVWAKNLNAPKLSVSCPADVEADAANGVCQSTLTVPSPVVSNPCNEAYTVTNNSPYKTSDTDASGTYPVGTTTVHWIIVDASGNSFTCDQDVVISDKQAPVITCPPNVTVAATAPNCTIPAVTIDPLLYTDNCGIQSVTWEKRNAANQVIDSGSGDVNGSSFPVGVTTVIYMVTDVHSNSSTCSFTVTVNDQTFPVIQTCPGDVTAVASLGICEVELALDKPTAYDPCGQIFTITHNSIYADHPGSDDASGSYPVGATEITWSIRDASGNVSTCTQTVTVTDTQAPTITCPAGVTVTATAPDCQIPAVTLARVIVSDNCGISQINWEKYDSEGTLVDAGTGDLNDAPGGLSFYVGVTTVTYTVTDVNGLTASCSFTVTVNDQTFPVVQTCPQLNYVVNA